MVKFNPNKVRGLMAEEKLTQEALSKKLNCSTRTFNLKLNSKIEFKVSDIEKLACIFNKGIEYFFE